MKLFMDLYTEISRLASVKRRLFMIFWCVFGYGFAQIYVSENTILHLSEAITLNNDKLVISTPADSVGENKMVEKGSVLILAQTNQIFVGEGTVLFDFPDSVQIKSVKPEPQKYKKTETKLSKVNKEVNTNNNQRGDNKKDIKVIKNQKQSSSSFLSLYSKESATLTVNYRLDLSFDLTTKIIGFFNVRKHKGKKVIFVCFTKTEDFISINRVRPPPFVLV